MTRPLFTYRDATDHLAEHIGGDSGRDAQAYRRAADEALLDLQSQRAWSTYRIHGRLTTVAPYGEGTIVYDHTGSANEREVTLTSGTWPTWAAHGVLVISQVRYDVDKRVSDTILTLEESSNPGADVASTEYSLQREAYPVPDDFGHMLSGLFDARNRFELGKISGKEALQTNRLIGPSEPFAFSIVGSTDFQGAAAFELTPIPASVKNYDYHYVRRSRALRYEAVDDGTITITSGSATVTGSGTAFADAHIGSVIRVSSTSDAPTGRYGSNPFAEERLITAVSSATSLTVDEAWGQSLSGKQYIISDPVDIDLSVMLNAYRRGLEAKVAHLRSKDDRQSAEAMYQEELIRAASLDIRDNSPRGVGHANTMTWPEVRVRYGQTGA